jgi:hypothetical protein
MAGNKRATRIMCEPLDLVHTPRIERLRPKPGSAVIGLIKCVIIQLNIVLYNCYCRLNSIFSKKSVSSGVLRRS